MGETWYRGEGIGVAPATPGSTPDHDLGDGMYLTDKVESATEYAKLRAPDARSQRVWSADINRQSLRVLDLTSDSRWRASLPMLEPLIKSANENYGRIFKGFIQQNKINLSDFDAVVGLDYVRGGRQMVILFRGGKPSDLHLSIRKSFQPVSTAANASPASFAIKPRIPGTFGIGVRAIGTGLVMLGLEYLGAWLMGKVEGPMIESQMRALEPKILEAIKKRSAAVAKIQAKGSKAYAWVTVEISRRQVASGGYGYVPSYGVLKLFHVEIGDVVVKTENKFDDSDIGGPETITRYTYSFEVRLSDDEMKLFNALMAEHAHYELLTQQFPGNAVMRAELDKVRERISQTLGASASRDLWNVYMWPTFKYKSQR